jgi:hypothetical protein
MSDEELRPLVITVQHQVLGLMHVQAAVLQVLANSDPALRRALIEAVADTLGNLPADERFTWAKDVIRNQLAKIASGGSEED